MATTPADIIHDRACDRARKAIEACLEYRYHDRSGLVFLLKDLMHWADSQGNSFADALADAEDYYDAERRA